MKIFSRSLPIEKIIGYKFSDRALLEVALTHPSAAASSETSYQRMEFLGDAILDFIVAEWFYLSDSHALEGELTELRRILVNCAALAKIVRMFELDRFIVYDDGGGSGIHLTDSVLCDIYEAIVAAVFLDGGMRAAKLVVTHTLLDNADVLLNSPSFTNHKGRLLERLQSMGRHPRYVVLETSGPSHRMQFKVAVYVGDRLLGVGSGSSKKDAEQNAAEHALKELG